MVVVGGKDFEKCLNYESRALMNGITAFIKETPENFLSLPPFEDTTRSLRPGRGPSLDHAGTLISDFQPPGR